MTKRQRGDTGEKAGQGPDGGPCWPREGRGFPSLPGEKAWRVLSTRRTLDSCFLTVVGAAYKTDGKMRGRGVSREVREDGT